MKNVVILGSTGSIGRQALEIISDNPGGFNVIGLSAHTNTELLAEQSRRFRPTAVCISDPMIADRLDGKLPAGVDLLVGQAGLNQLAKQPEAELVLNALVGAVGVEPTLAAITADKQLALANKESLVAAGPLVRQALAQSKATILPVDSEHSALFQCLRGELSEAVRRLILTASGGPFLGWDNERLKTVTVNTALDHPRWAMGQRVTIDSATMANKGMEVIEAQFLFDIPYEQISILVHPQSVVHSLVEFVDGSVKAQLSITDMRLPIAFALGYPERLPLANVSLPLLEIGKLTFQEPDWEGLPCLRAMLIAARQGESYPTAVNAADEVAVARFLSGEIGFTAIGEILHRVIDRHEARPLMSLEDFLSVDAWGRELASDTAMELAKAQGRC